ncbi:MAG: fumarylacetoacetate hydrolase family protein [Candidatus Obscuribacterales bacterium]|nr:fumarylacetoacetate hydrolase family protein [Candidatus Obscuribacterales bacterium]
MLYSNTCNTVEIFGVKVPEPKVLLDFLGFETHVRQIRDKRGVSVSPTWYDHAAYYVVDLPADKVFGPDETVDIPSFIKAPDYEFEIGCLATKDALLTDENQALEYFREHCQLTILNDWSARDVQKKDMDGLGPTNSKFILGKSIGPCWVPAKDMPMDDNGVMDMEMVLEINGQVRNQSNYQSLYHTHPTTGEKAAWSFPRIFAFLGKQNIKIKAGYLFGSGTVGSGCIAEFQAKVDPKTNQVLAPATLPWLADGDAVTMKVSGIGSLSNTVRIV